MAFITYFILVICFTVLIITYWQSKRYNLPPGISGLPLIGWLPSGKTPLSTQVSILRNKFGDIFRWRMGSQTCVFLCSYEVIKEALQNPALQGRPNFYSFKIITNFENEGIINNEGKSLQDLRKFILRIFNERGVCKNAILDAVGIECKALVEDFSQYCAKPTVIPWSVNAAVLNTIWKFVGGFRYDVNEDRIQELHKVINVNFSHIQGRLFIFNLMPWLTYVIPSFIRKIVFKENEFIEGINKLMSEMKDEIESHKKKFDESNIRDMIDAYLLQLRNQNMDGNCLNENFSEKQLMYVVADLFGAASETTSSTIRWFLLYMAKFPDVQKKIQNEIDRNVLRASLPKLEDIENLHYFKACVQEILRCKSIAPLGLFHAATQDTQIQGYDIPKGTLIAAHIEGCHKEEGYWERPFDFYPNHFLNMDNTYRSRRHNIPFSAGRRYCLGSSFAITTLYLFLSCLLQNYQFQSCKKYPINLEPDPSQPVFVIPKQHKIMILKRKKKPIETLV